MMLGRSPALAAEAVVKAAAERAARPVARERGENAECVIPMQRSCRLIGIKTKREAHENLSS